MKPDLSTLPVSQRSERAGQMEEPLSNYKKELFFKHTTDEEEEPRPV
jgi:hypothetical protein